MKSIPVLLAALLLAACSQTPPDTREADIKAIKDIEAQWNKDFAAKDADKLVAHYADNAVLMNPGMPAASGKDAIRKVFVPMVADPALSLQFTASMVEVAKSGDLGWTQGSYTMTMTDPNSKAVVHDHGSYVTTWAKQTGGDWKAVADIAASDVPAAAPAAAKSNAKAAKKRRK